MDSDDHNKNLLILVLHYLMERELNNTARSLERETGIYFNMNYLEELVMTGSFDKAEDYLEGFISMQDNKHSIRTLFQLRKLKFIEALHDGATRFATDIANAEIAPFTRYSPRAYNQAMKLVSLVEEESMEMGALRYISKAHARRFVLEEMKECLRQNPVVRDKLELPSLESTLQRLFASVERAAAAAAQINGGAVRFFPFTVVRNNGNDNNGNGSGNNGNDNNGNGSGNNGNGNDDDDGSVVDSS